MKRVINRFRRAFLAGLLVVVPVGVTIWVMLLLVGFLENFQPVGLIGYKIPGLGVVLALSTTLGLGMAAESVLGRSFLNLYERVVARVPFLSAVYNGIKQLMVQVFQSDKGFEQVVLVQWPRKGLYSLGFLTSDAPIIVDDGKQYVNIFLPSTPNPTTGFYFMVPLDELVITELTIEDAFKQLMSVGIVAPPKKIVIATKGQAPRDVRESNG
jgi:uncharacterized membrane protein